jgi:hypothetical protein
MTSPDSRLFQLLAAARSAGPEPITAMPRALQNRVLAHWDLPNVQGEIVRSLHILFRRAAVCASALMLASIVWSIATGNSPPEDDLALANLELREGVLP